MPEKRVGKVEHYYPKVQAAAVGLSGPLKVGDKVHIVGHGDDFEEKVTSLELDHKPIEEGKPGQSVGLWVKERVHEGDEVYVVEGREKTATKKAPLTAPAARKPAGARATKAARKTRTRRASSKRASKGTRRAASGPKRKPARAATRGKRVRKTAAPKRKRPVGRAGRRTGGKRPGRRGAARKTSARKRSR